MIPTNDITAWAHGAPWPTPDQVEQDLLLSQVICLIAQDDYLGDELVFRGGTCLHKLYLQPSRRYSEDLDYVRATAGGIGKVTRAISDIGTRLGYDVRTSPRPVLAGRRPSSEVSGGGLELTFGHQHGGASRG